MPASSETINSKTNKPSTNQTYRTRTIPLTIIRWIGITMAPHQEDIASKLLQSSDARIAEAAKRVFSSTLPIVSTNLTSATPLAVHSSVSAFNDYSMYTETTSGAVDQMEYNIHPNQALHATAEYQHTTNINSTTTNSTASNDDLLEDNEDGEKKPSSTERLKRR